MHNDRIHSHFDDEGQDIREVKASTDSMRIAGFKGIVYSVALSTTFIGS